MPLDQVAEAQDEDEVAEDQRGLEHSASDVASPCFDEIAANPEVDDQRGEHEKMSAEAHSFSVQESITRDDAFNAEVDIASALDSLTLVEVEEAAGELHRRIGAALRDIGERRADRGGRESPRARVAALAVATEAGALTLGAVAAGSVVHLPRLDAHPTTVAAAVYAAPTIQALLARLDQDRRLLASLARALEPRFDEECDSPWGHMSLHRLVVELAIVRPARLALELERLADEAEV